MKKSKCAPSVLLQLYCGEISPCEQYQPKAQEYRRRVQEYCRQEGEFVEKLRALEPELASEFLAILDSQTDEVPLKLSEMFIDGFCLGARLMAEVYQRDCSEEEP